MSNVVQVHGRTFREIISNEVIRERVSELAREIEADYKGKNPVFLPVLNGSFMFAADLMRQILFPCEIEFVSAKSYRGMQSTGEVYIETFFKQPKWNRHLVILEDIVDTGRTLRALIERLQEERPATISVATVLVKPHSIIEEVAIKYRGFDIGDEFVVGYGLDYDGLGRNLPGIYQEAGATSVKS